MLDLVAEHAEYFRDPFEPPLRGRVAIRAYWNSLVERQTAATFQVERSWVVARTVLCSWHGSYRREGVEGQVAGAGFMTIELDDAGLIRRVREWSLSDR